MIKTSLEFCHDIPSYKLYLSDEEIKQSFACHKQKKTSRLKYCDSISKSLGQASSLLLVSSIFILHLRENDGGVSTWDE